MAPGNEFLWKMYTFVLLKIFLIANIASNGICVDTCPYKNLGNLCFLKVVIETEPSKTRYVMIHVFNNSGIYNSGSNILQLAPHELFNAF